MAARSPEKGNEAVEEVKKYVPGAAVQFLEMDLSSFDSIKAAARKVLADSERLDILMLNAGRKIPFPMTTGSTFWPVPSLSSSTAILSFVKER